MEPMSARASLAYQIKKAGREDILECLRAFEKSLPQGRYLQGFEICQYLTKLGRKNTQNLIEIENPTEQDSEMLDNLWRDYERQVIWPGEAFEEQHPEVESRSKVETIHAWEDWACERLGFEPVMETTL